MRVLIRALRVGRVEIDREEGRTWQVEGTAYMEA